jgi:chromosome segregation ATPase
MGEDMAVLRVRYRDLQEAADRSVEKRKHLEVQAKKAESLRLDNYQLELELREVEEVRARATCASKLRTSQEQLKRSNQDLETMTAKNRGLQRRCVTLEKRIVSQADRATENKALADANQRFLDQITTLTEHVHSSREENARLRNELDLRTQRADQKSSVRNGIEHLPNPGLTVVHHETKPEVKTEVLKRDPECPSKSKEIQRGPMVGIRLTKY